MAKVEKPKEKMEIAGSKKRVRQRKLSLYESIRKQMEFYFSTPNLQKDRFLKKLVTSEPDGFIDIENFLNFNKIKSLTTDVAYIVKALKESETLLVDETGKKVRRKVKYEEPQDTDQRTVYAEFLPKDVTIDWLINHFSSAGRVVHVSLPKYKSSGDVKGFAFVEFETIEGAVKACELLNSPPQQFSSSKPGMFAKTFKTGRHMQKPLEGEASEVIDDNKEVIEDDHQDMEAEAANDRSNKKKKKKRCSSDMVIADNCSSLSEDVDSKKLKKKRKCSDSNDCAPAKVLKLEEVDTTNKITDVEQETAELEQPEMEKLQKEKKKPVKKKLKQGVEHSSSGLRVISKQEWMDYRHDYYEKHKKNMSDLKTKIREVKIEQTVQTRWTNLPLEDVSETVAMETSKDGLVFLPDVIIKVALAEPVSKKFLREQMCESGKVSFLDMVDGELTAHARCSDPQSAADILKTSSHECQFVLLKGEEEKSYWGKVFSDREKRLNTKTKKKIRGSDKVLAKADKVLKSIKEKAVHIVFED